MKELRKKFRTFKTSRGGIEILILVIVIIGSFLMVGGFNFTKKNGVSTSPAPLASYLCCDSGDGDSCKVNNTTKFMWKGTNPQPEEYALIKSAIALSEGTGHIAQAPAPDDKTPNGERIFLNTTSQTYPNGYPGQESTCPSGTDFVFGLKGCIGIPNDEIIYVCKDNCAVPGFGKAKFDAYFRIKDGAIPDVIKNCSKPTSSAGGGGEQEIVIPKTETKKTLQLKAFKIIEKPASTSWLSPYCKPAVYLYPEKTSYISVKLNPVGPITYSDPLYEKTGWGVIADPTGIILYNDKSYDYLYYETQIPDGKIKRPKDGYVVETKNLSSFFEKILPSLDLNDKETKQFSDYWLKALPKSPFYFVGVVSKADLDLISPLSINPNPKNIIRVTLYFEPLDQKITASPPVVSKIERNGFTVVEWGGIFKKDKNHDFSCLQ